MRSSKNYLVVLFLLISVSVFSQNRTEKPPFKNSFNFGKSVAVFGGSVSVIPESESAKSMWENYLGMTVTNYGVPGAGFSSLQGKSMQRQVDEAGVFDIYILWASTNDYTNHRDIGSYTDYTEFDGYDKKKLTSQAGGINYCIRACLNFDDGQKKSEPERKQWVTKLKSLCNLNTRDSLTRNGR